MSFFFFITIDNYISTPFHVLDLISVGGRTILLDMVEAKILGAS